MKIYPNLYTKKVTDLDYNFLIKNDIKGLILDVDNTLLDFDLNLVDGLEDWCKNLKKQNIKIMLLSNTNKTEKVKIVAELLNVPYEKFAIKPLKRGFKKAMKILDLPNKNIGVVGDQIFTDVIGANRCKMFSILVEPLAQKDIWITRLKRPLENFIINKYLKKISGENE